jgi:hypothetical protein
MKRSRIFGLATVATALCLATPSSATAAPPSVSDPIATGLVGPLQFDVGDHGQLYVGENFAGLLTRVTPAGRKKVLYAERNGEVGGVASNGHDVAWTYTEASETPEATLRRLGSMRRPAASARGAVTIPDGLLRLRRSDGRVTTLANLAAYEARHNPDGGQSYGFQGLSDECAASVPDYIGGEPYAGIVESHPYAVANGMSAGGWYVADAAANAIFHVGRRGRITLVDVLPAQKTTITASAAEQLGLPECTVGEKYAFEPVPTDVEVDQFTGKLVVSLLPGGPEDDSLGARGAVYRVNPRTHRARKVAGGFLSATNVALGRGGRIYVAELFADRISVIRDGRVHTLIQQEGLMPAAVEYANGKVYASTQALGPEGQIVTISR